jgi:hypothetical protein
MLIPITKPAPSPQELAQILQGEFSPQYSYKLFGLGKAKSLLVGKSIMVGAQISIRNNEITIQGSPPSIFGGLLSFLGITEIGLALIFFLGTPWALYAQWKSLEKELGLFLKQKFN